MIARRTINWSLALLLAAILSTSYLLDGPSDIDTEQAIADDLREAVQTAQVQP